MFELIPARDDGSRVRLVAADKLTKADFMAIAEALDTAHLSGVVHGDVKPANVVLDEQRPVLVDFGLATPWTGADEGDASGTPAYMAPEQARGQSERLDVRSDVIGCMHGFAQNSEAACVDNFKTD